MVIPTTSESIQILNLAYILKIVWYFLNDAFERLLNEDLLIYIFFVTLLEN